jgi:hypothetical protein
MKGKADVILEQTAAELKALLKEIVQYIELPYFPGSDFKVIEAEPTAIHGNKYACVVLCEDGELRELHTQMDIPMANISAFARRDDLRDVDIPPRDYIPFAHSALEEAIKLAKGERTQAAEIYEQNT